MWPRTAAGEDKERARKRRTEGAVMLKILQDELNARTTDSLILEFGSGAGYQAEWLRRLGRCVFSDVYIDGSLTATERGLFVVCDVAKSPFRSKTFNMIFSNHVIEHLSELTESFLELQRIGCDDCIYAFAVPTAAWLILSLPAQYWAKVTNLLARLAPCPSPKHLSDASAGSLMRAIDAPTVSASSGLAKLLPHGHGRHRGFLECFHAFRTVSWRRHFLLYGFTLLSDKPVLCYAPSAWPIVPTNRALTKIGLCSSRLFILRKNAHRNL